MKIMAVLFLLVLFPSVQAQKVQYRTLKMEEMARCLQQKGWSVLEKGLYDAAGICPGKKIEIRKDIFGRIGYIGFHLFGEEMKRQYSSPVYDFIGRYLLELMLEGKSMAAVRLKEDKVGIELDGSRYGNGLWELEDFIVPLDSTARFVLESGEEGYRAGWKTDRNTMTLTFPRQYELIFGSDKVEMEKGFLEELARAEAKRTSWDTLNTADLILTARKGVYVRKGNSYLIPDMNSDTYYKDMGNGKATLFFEQDMVAESFANLFLEGFYGQRKVNMHIEHHCYGNRISRISVDVQNFVSYCISKKSRIYYAPEEMNGETIKGTVLVVNQDLGYNHLLYFESSTGIFQLLRPDMKVHLYTYVPNHNVKNLFQDYKK